MDYDVIIIGAGIVGLATGLKLKEKKPGVKLAILEKEARVAMHQTGNNSGVIHAGVYYKPGSLKALNCLSRTATPTGPKVNGHLPIANSQ